MPRTHRSTVCPHSPSGWLLVATLLAGAPLLRAQPSVQLKLESRELFVGEAVSLAIQVSDFQTCEPPEVPTLVSATLVIRPEASESSFTQIVNGRMTQTHSREYRGELVPLAVGELVIPPITVRVNGEPQQTQPVRLVVKPSDADELLSVEISVAGRKRIYVGQRVPLTMTVWVKPVRFGGQLADAGDMLRALRPVDFGPFPHQVARTGRGQRPGGEAKDVYYSYEFTTEHTPERPGQLTFDNIVVGAEYPVGRGRRNLRARPRVEPLEILPVPQEGRPASYAGAVGVYDIKATAQPTDVRVGDPIELTIELFGDGPVATLPPPLLAENAALADAFRIPGEQLAGETVDARRRFKVTLRAKRDDVREVPAIEYPYFDPTAERFVVARSAPLPLRVSPAAEVAAPEVATPARPASTAALTALDGLRDIETDERRLLATPTPLTSALVLATALGPPAAFAVVWALTALHQARAADPRQRRRRAALRTALGKVSGARSLSTAEGAGRLSAALREYLSDRTGEPAARFAGAGALEFLRQRGASPELIERARTLIQRCDELTYAGGAVGDVDGLCAEATACLKALERQRL
jgi:hypothetical protein